MYGENFELQSDCFERQRKVAQSARWGYATTPKIPHRTFLRNGFEDIVCGIHPRELLHAGCEVAASECDDYRRELLALKAIINITFNSITSNPGESRRSNTSTG